MRKSFKCKKNLLNLLKEKYDKIVEKEYNKDYLKTIQDFDFIAEEKLRNTLNKFYNNQRSRDQAWKICKGSLYEYAVFKCIQQVLVKSKLDKKFLVIEGDKILQYKEQIAIPNWNDIFPDIDLLVVERKTNLVKIIISCKTSLRERLTETAFWKRELEKTKKIEDIKLIFITTDKDKELKIDTNRYILLHVIDCTFITNPKIYKELIEFYHKKYGDREDFNRLLSKIKFIEEIGDFLKNCCKKF